MTNELKTMDQSNELRSRRSNKTKNEDTKQTKRWYRLRLIPIWLRIVLVLLLWSFAMIIGLMLGFSVLGDGKAFDVLKWDTWQHILDIMNGN